MHGSLAMKPKAEPLPLSRRRDCTEGGGEKGTLGSVKTPPASEKTLTPGSQLDVNSTCLSIGFDKAVLMCASGLQQAGKAAAWDEKRLHSTTENIDKIRLLF